jgi:hypothetical protein
MQKNIDLSTTNGNLISSCHPGDIPASIDACLKKLQRPKAA